MMTTNTPVLLKAWVTALFQALAFCLLGSVGVSIAYAQGLAGHAPSAEMDTSTPSHEMAFAKYSDGAGQAKKMAGCLIVSSTDAPSHKNVYCRYVYPAKGRFCDSGEGLNPDSVKLDLDDRLQKHFTKWFTTKYPQHRRLTDNEVKEILAFMSSEEQEFSQGKTVFGQQPKTITLTKLDSSQPPEQYKKIPQKGFAWLVHHSIKQQMVAKPAENNSAENQPGENQPGEIKPGETKSAETKQEETKQEETKPNETKPDETKQGETPPTDNKLIKQPVENAMIWLVGLGILVIVVILALLWLLLLAKRNTQLVTELRQEISSAFDEKISQLQTQQQIEYKTTSQQHFDKLREELKNVRLEQKAPVQPLTPEEPEEPTTSAQGPSEQKSEPTPPQKQPEVKEQLESSQRIQELEQDKNRLEHDLEKKQNELRLEQEQHDKAEKALKETEDQLNTVTNQQADKVLEGIRTQLNEVLENSQKMPKYAEAEATLKGLKTVITQYTDEKEKRQQADNALKDIRIELYRVVNSTLSEDAETTLEGLKTLINQYHDAKTQREQADKTLGGIRTQLNEVLEKSQKLPEGAEAEKTLDCLKTVITQYKGEKEKREKAHKALKNISTELNKVAKTKEEDAEKTLESIQSGVLSVIRDLRTKETELEKLTQQYETEKTALAEANNELKTLTEQYETEKTALAEANNELKTLTEHEQALQQDITSYALIREPLDSKEWTEERLKKLRTEINQSLKNAKKKQESLSQQYETEKTALADAQNELKTLTENKQTLQNVLHGRFRLVKPEGTDFSHWTTALIEQQGTWRWAQLTLVGELLACEIHVKQIKEQGDDKAQNILALLELDKPSLKPWNTLVGHLFDSDTQLWQFLRSTDSGKWLNRLLRASDLLQAYFKQEPQFGLLSRHLSNVAGILQAVCAELGVQLIKPQLLEKVPDDIPKNNRRYTPYPDLKALVKPQVLEKLKTVPKFVVDIETYGFVTVDNPKPDVRVFVASLAEWE
jgi:hypothetical protein